MVQTDPKRKSHKQQDENETEPHERILGESDEVQALGRDPRFYQNVDPDLDGPDTVPEENVLHNADENEAKALDRETDYYQNLDYELDISGTGVPENDWRDGPFTGDEDDDEKPTDKHS